MVNKSEKSLEKIVQENNFVLIDSYVFRRDVDDKNLTDELFENKLNEISTDFLQNT